MDDVTLFLLGLAIHLALVAGWFGLAFALSWLRERWWDDDRSH